MSRCLYADERREILNFLYLSDKFRMDLHLSLAPVETVVRTAVPGPIFRPPPTHREWKVDSRLHLLAGKTTGVASLLTSIGALGS